MNEELNNLNSNELPDDSSLKSNQGETKVDLNNQIINNTNQINTESEKNPIYVDQNNSAYNISNSQPYDNDLNLNNQQFYTQQVNSIQQSGYQNFNTDYQNLNNGYYGPVNVKNSKKKDKKPHKKNGFFSAMKVVFAAILFGLVASSVYQGVNYFTNRNDHNKKQEEIKVASEVQSSDTIKEDNKGNDKDIILNVDTNNNGIVTDVSGVVENVMPSIVAINSTGTMTNYDFFGNEINQPVQGSGSGIIIGQNGSELLIVTNNHVIAGSEQVEIVFSDESTAKAVVKGADARADLAVLSVNMGDLSDKTSSTIRIAKLGDSTKVKPGEMSIAIGNALGYGQSVTVGYISALEREVQIENNTMKLLQTDAAINPGNSGGALINTSGEVIGINSVKYASQEVEGMGYAIPISDAIPMINELMNRETLAESEQGFLGINVNSAQNVTEAYSKQFNMPIGIYVKDIVKDSPVEKAGLKPGSIITGFNDKTVETIDDLVNILSYTKAGEKITLVVQEMNNGGYAEKKLSVTLGKRIE